jgi:hypothetical protein
MYAYLTCSFISFSAAGVILILFLNNRKTFKLEQGKKQKDGKDPEAEGLKNSTDA